MREVATVAASAGMRGFRASILHYFHDPSNPSPNGAKPFGFHKDGLLVVSINTGRVVDCGDYSDLRDAFPHVSIKEYADCLITPGFVDCHVHYPQIEMIGSYGEQLLEWLDKYTFPAELGLKNNSYEAHRLSRLFCEECVTAGTTTALVFCTSDPISVDCFFAEAQRRNMRMIAGKVMMDRNAPPGLLDTPQTSYDDSQWLINKWHGRDRLQYAVTPRFAPTSSKEQLAAAGKLLKENPTVYCHTHLAENLNECDWVQSLFPESTSYLDVYDRFGLTGPRSVFAHSIHLSDDDWKTFQRTDSRIAACPLSNNFLGSGFFNFKQASAHGVKYGLGTDVGAGTSMSMLRVQGSTYSVSKLSEVMTSKRNITKLQQQQPQPQPPQLEAPDAAKTPADPIRPHPMELMYMATLGGAVALSLDQHIGNFLPGKEADFVVLDLKAALIRPKVNQGVAALVFALAILGDQRCVRATYVLGDVAYDRDSGATASRL